MSTLIIDTEPCWLKFCQECGFDTADHVKPGYDTIILSSRMMHLISEADCSIVVATGCPTSDEMLEAYRKGAVDYIAKDLWASTLERFK